MVEAGLELPEDDPLAVAATAALHAGDVDATARLLAAHPELARARIRGRRRGGGSRTLLHLFADWPGQRPHAREIVALLVAAGADLDATCNGPNSETALHWAASSDDVELIDALLDAGADLEARGAVIAGGTPIADATAFGQWRAADRLLERGARTNLFESAVMGLQERVRGELVARRPPGRADHEGALGRVPRAPAGDGSAAPGARCGHRLDRVGWPHAARLRGTDRGELGVASALPAWLRAQGAASALGPG